MCWVLKNGLCFLRAEATNQNPAARLVMGRSREGGCGTIGDGGDCGSPGSTCPQVLPRRNDGLPRWIF